MVGNDTHAPSISTASPVVPLHHAGQWIAWNSDGTRIVSSGRTLQEAAQAAAAAGETHPIFTKVPKAAVRRCANGSGDVASASRRKH